MVEGPSRQDRELGPGVGYDGRCRTDGSVPAPDEHASRAAVNGSPDAWGEQMRWDFVNVEAACSTEGLPRCSRVRCPEIDESRYEVACRVSHEERGTGKNRTEAQPLKILSRQAVDGLRDIRSRVYLMRSQLKLRCLMKSRFVSSSMAVVSRVWKFLSESRIRKFFYESKRDGLTSVTREEYFARLLADPKRAERAFEKAWAIRNFETEMYWKRALHFW